MAEAFEKDTRSSYGSTNYKYLLYAKMMTPYGGFTPISMKTCLAGRFTSKKYGHQDVKKIIKRLLSRNFIYQIENTEKYAITEIGLMQIHVAVSDYRKEMERSAGTKYMMLARQRLNDASVLGSATEPEAMDLEDKVLEDMYIRFLRRKAIKGGGGVKTSTNQRLANLPEPNVI